MASSESQEHFGSGYPSAPIENDQQQLTTIRTLTREDDSLLTPIKIEKSNRPSSAAGIQSDEDNQTNQDETNADVEDDFDIGTIKVGSPEDITRKVLEDTTVEEKVETVVMSYLIPLAVGTVIMTTCYGLGRFGYSVGWIGIFVALNFIKSKLWRQREKRVLALRQAAMREREVILAQLQDLPAWVTFPDTERVEWINKVILQLWPYIGEYTKKFVKELIEPQVKASLPGAFRSFHFEEIDMGDIPMRVGGIKVYTENVGRDKIIMDMDVSYAGDCNFVVAVGAFKGGLNQMQFKGKLRVQLKPLISQPPMVGGVTAYFLDDPTIDFNLTGLGEMVEIPGLMGAIRKVVTTQVRAIAVLPNEIVVPLTNETDVAALHFPEPDGVLRIGISEARDLENKDVTFIKKGKSDPYCRVSVGAQNFKTETIDNDLSPKWGEYFEAVVDQANGQKLIVEVFDEDSGSNDEELGRLVLDLNMIRRKGSCDTWYQLEGAKHGDMRLKLYWMNLTSNPRDLSKDSWEQDWLNSKNPLNPALLMVYVDCASDIPFPKHNIEPSPYIQLTLGKEEQKTYPKPKTVNPLFQQKFLFFVKDPEHQVVEIEAFDDGTKRSLGECKVKINTLLAEPKMERYQETFALELGGHRATLVMTFRLRGMVAGDVPSLSPSTINAPIRNVNTPYSPPTLNIDRSNKPPAIPPLTIKLSSSTTMRQKSEPKGNQFTLGGFETIGDGLRVKALKNDPEIVKMMEYNLNFMPNAPSLSMSNLNAWKENRLKGTRSRVQRSRSMWNLRRKSIKNRKSLEGSSCGKILVGLKYQEIGQKLIVGVENAIDLESQNTDETADPYVKLILVFNHKKHVEERKSPTAKDTLNPKFAFSCEFMLPHSAITQYSLLVKVKDGSNYGLFRSQPTLGQKSLPLRPFKDGEQLLVWLDLETVKT